MDKKVNERQILHLIEAMRQSGYYFGEKGVRPKIDLKFIEALQVFLLDSKGKNVQRTVNAFRTICIESFNDVSNIDFVSSEVIEKVLEFLRKNLKSKACKKAEKFLMDSPVFFSKLLRFPGYIRRKSRK
jgi:hypothetical protein